MKEGITVAATLFVSSFVAVGSAIANPAHMTVSGAPASWRSNQTQQVQPSENNSTKPVDARDKQEVKPIEGQVSIPTADTTQCTGDAKSSTPPVVNNTHHIRNVVWRNMRMACTR
jgi:hypothetical protein